jgi:hypothetical protein
MDFTSTVVTNYLVPEPTGYDKVTLYGELYCDYMWGVNRVMDDEEIAKTKAYNFKPSWSSETLLLANYDDSLQGGSASTLNETIQSWSVYRKRTSDTQLSFVQTLDKLISNITDYNVANQTEYEYYIFPETLNTVGEAMISNPITTDWWYWTIFDIIPTANDNIFYADNDNVWKFDLNLSSGTTVQNLDKQSYDGFAQFPKISIGNRDYATGTITCLIGKVENSQYTDTVKMHENFKLFVKNGKKKILKDIKGNIYMIDIMENSFTINDTVTQQPITITFNWKQIGETKDISIIEQDS